MSNFFQEGISHKEVSQAEVDNVNEFFNNRKQAILSSSAIDWCRNDGDRLRLQMERLKRELRFVLNQEGISPTSVEVLKTVLNDDDAVSVGTASDTSDKTDYSQVRYQNIPLATLNELNDLVRKNTGVLNRIVNLIQQINFTRIAKAKMEGDLSNKIAARKAFEAKRTKDAPTFERLRNELLSLSAILGYVEALLSLVYDYPEVSATDHTVRALSEKFDMMCWKWVRYRKKLRDSVQDYTDSYADYMHENMPSPISGEIFNQIVGQRPDNVTDIIKILDSVYFIKVNRETVNFNVFNNPAGLFNAIVTYLDNEEKIPPHYTGVPKIKPEVVASLESMHLALFVVSQSLENDLDVWSGNTARIDSNSAVKQVIDKAREMVASPVRRTLVNPLMRDEYLAKTLIDFKGVSEQVKKVRNFLETKAELLQSKITDATFDNEFLRKVFFRRSMPVADNMNNAKPVEDAVRERVRKRYGPNVPFEDEQFVKRLNMWVKESNCVQDPKTGDWDLRGDVAAEILAQLVPSTNVSQSQ